MASIATTAIGVRAQRCTLKALTRRLRPGGLGVLVTCDARSGVRIAARAMVARKGRLRAFRLQFGTLRGTVTAGRPTVLVIKPAAGVLPALRAAAHRHQRMSLKLTLTASSHATTRTTTTRVRRSGWVDGAQAGLTRDQDRADEAGRGPRGRASRGNQAASASSVRFRSTRLIRDPGLEQMQVVVVVVGVDEQLAERDPVLDPAAELLVHLPPGGVARRLAAPDRAAREVPGAVSVGVAHEQHVVAVGEHALDPDDARAGPGTSTVRRPA